jgi:P pilus assembly chaperone PapD
MPWHLNIM